MFSRRKSFNTYRPSLQRWEVLDHLRQMYYDIDRYVSQLPTEVVGISCGDVRRDAYATLKSIETTRGKMIEAMFQQGLSPVRDADAISGPMIGWPAASSTPIHRSPVTTRAPDLLAGTATSSFTIGGMPIGQSGTGVISFRDDTEAESSYVFSSIRDLDCMHNQSAPAATNQAPVDWAHWETPQTNRSDPNRSDPGMVMQPRMGCQNPRRMRPVMRVQRVSNLAQMEQSQVALENPESAVQMESSHDTSAMVEDLLPQLQYKSFL